MKHETLFKQIEAQITNHQGFEDSHDMLTLCLAEADLVKHMTTLRDHPDLHFEMLSDVCGVDYLDYGVDDWRGNSTTAAGYTRAKRLHEARPKSKWDKPRFAVVYHLLSLKHNRRIRVKVYLPEGSLKIPSVIQLWPSADWFEREAYDLYGIEFVGHPDLRRLLTDYGFKGHPFRKDFPLEGHVEMFYDAEKERCVYQPVTIHPRVNIPKVIRDDARYVPETGLPKEETSNG